ncbi:bifunctional enoyl-CoA hydratase/phosphate acetyltransferase [Chiayiivirga flava]|uniref:Phosphate acetyltransferase/phosphate butyryltransferase n=1 Tax=Chiayiivirga flava TaxID=659595 RepID=A0A7W8FYW0_9GAMM|nr:bifunctional enoyl-CoA hydratase/phosphate acetyltransferase [Chiayiivirga flava]MBB5206544.1 phosphate acetyltransferase/phosphate butyryltransferase [Chiayiivirga flava]
METEAGARPALAGKATPALRNRTFEELAIGDRAQLVRTLSDDDIRLFALVSGDWNPQHVDVAYAERTPLRGIVAHGMWAGALLSAVLGTQLPGPGTVYIAQTLRFLAPVRVGDTVTAAVTVVARDPDTRRVRLACRCTNQTGTCVLAGEADVIAPAERVERSVVQLPGIRWVEAGTATVLERARGLPAIRVAVVHPCDAPSLQATVAAATAGTIAPRIVAPRARIDALAAAHGLDVHAFEIDDVPHSHAAAARAVALAAGGSVDALMKGSLHTDELMSAMLAHDGGLRTERRISHCFLLQTPAYPRPFILTDAAINIEPDLDAKADIVRNAIDLAHAIGVAEPRVAILAAVETVNGRMRATLDAAALCKMADRGQIAGAAVDGPLAFDNAISPVAAARKAIRSPVAGQADILVVPDLESGNMLAKQLMYFGDASSAGLVLGARVPIVLGSRADTVRQRVDGCALAALFLHADRHAPA